MEGEIVTAGSAVPPEELHEETARTAAAEIVSAAAILTRDLRD
ncbi:hypothetical protein ACWC9T_17425 [Kitasatospora sp. NPDC001159]